MRINKDRLELAMADNCMTAYDICEKVKMPYPTFSKVKRDESCKPATAGKIAKALNVPVQDLLED